MSRSPFARLPDDSSRLLPYDVNSYHLDEMTPGERRTIPPSPPPLFYRLTNEKANSVNKIGNCGASQSMSHSDSKISGRSKPIKTPPSITRSLLLCKPTTEPIITRLRFRDSHTKLDPLLVLNRREKAAQVDIQLLLDAQSSALLQSYENSGYNHSDVGSKMSVDKKLKDIWYPGVIPVRQPRSKPIGLRGARIGLTAKMEELIDIKCEELAVYEHEISIRKEALVIAENWERKIVKLREQLSNHCNDRIIGPWEGEGADEEDLELTQLKKEEKLVEIEIHQLEDKLLQLKARHEQLRQRISESTNKQEARLSSYRGALRNAELEVKNFLKNPPVPDSIITGEENSFTGYPLSERSLTMAIAWWNKELSHVRLLKQKAEKEKMALEEGVQVWEDCTRIIINFESDLRKELRSERIKDVDSLKDQLMKMDSIIKSLEDNLHMAERKGWNLLICATSAELEALRGGQDILKKSVETVGIESHLETHQSLHSSRISSDQDLFDADDDDLQDSLG